MMGEMGAFYGQTLKFDIENYKSRPNMIEEGDLGWIVNTPTVGAEPMVDEIRMRAHATIRGVPVTTTLDGLRWSVSGLKAFKTANGHIKVRTIQEYHVKSPKVNKWSVKK